MSAQAARTRRVIVVDNSHVARRVGERIRQARTRVGLTQAQLAKGRYTAAYISALERGLAKPSMAALTFLSERLPASTRRRWTDTTRFSMLPATIAGTGPSSSADVPRPFAALTAARRPSRRRRRRPSYSTRWRLHPTPQSRA